jgi:hypothetical protein
VLTLLVAVAASGAAQTLTGSITGAVKDEQGGVLPGVTVTLSGAQGTRTTVTEADGTYRFPALEPGTYSVSAELSGFRPTRQDRIVVNAGTTLSVDLALAVGGVTEQINVLAESPVVDVKSSATQTTLSQELLFSAPITRTAINVLNYAPGINSSSAYGGEASTANALLIDGVDTRDPSGGTPWTFYNYNIVEEFQFQGLGAPAEYGAFTGAVVNTITKSGGNRYAGLFEVFGTNSSFASNNIDTEIATANPALADPNKTKKYLDITTQLGGPLVRDKLFFFASAQRFELEVDPSGAVTRRHETSPRVNAKLTWQPRSSDNFTAHIQFDSYNIIGRAGAGLGSTDELTNREDAPEWYWLGQWRHVFGPSTFSEVKYSGWWGFFDLNPEVNLPGRLDGGTGLNSVSQGWYYWADRGRHQVNASLSHYAQKFGAHEFKFGTEIERSHARDRYGYVDDIFFYDYYGAPYSAYNYGYDVKGINRRQSVFAQDAWKVGDRLTLNLGVRGDFIQGRHDDLGTVYSSNNWAPRLGVAWDVLGDYRTVLKASYGWYYEGAQVNLFFRALPGIEDTVFYEVNPDGTVGAEYARTPAFTYRVADDIKHPRLDEFTVGFERALRGDTRLTATVVWRDNKNFVNSINPSARWTPVVLTESLTNSPITLYRWANRTATLTDFEIRNIEGFQYLDPNGNVIGTVDPYRNYRALILVLNKRFTNRWQAQASYVLSKAEGTINNSGGAQLSTRQFETPTLALVNVDGEVTNSRRHEFKLLGTYQIPVIEVALNAYLAIYSGTTYAAFQQFSGTATTLGSGVTSAYRQPFIEPRGVRRNDPFSTLDLRIEKVFNVTGRDRVGVFAEIENLFNDNTITGRFTRVPDTTITVAPGETAVVDFEGPSSVRAARQVRLGLRWSF